MFAAGGQKFLPPLDSSHLGAESSAAGGQPKPLKAFAAGGQTFLPPPEPHRTATGSGAADGQLKPLTSVTAVESTPASVTFDPARDIDSQSCQPCTGPSRGGSESHGRLATKRSAPDADVDLRDLQLNKAWEKSFLDYTRNLNQPEGDQPALDSPQEEEDDDPDLTSTALQDLLELADDGIAVCWPQGIDARVARIILHRRRTMTAAKKLCDRASPA